MAIDVTDSVIAEDLAGVASLLQRSTVHVRSLGRGGGSGSGVIWRSDGLIVTNAHVARTAKVTVELHDGQIFDAETTARDVHRDLATLKVRSENLPAVTIGDSNSLRVGQLVTAVGNPLGMTGALTLGVVHAIAPARGHGHHTWVQADVTLLPGNSGGPLADVRGRVVGINSMVAGGLGLAVPSIAVEQFFGSKRQQAQLGLILQPVAVPHRGRPLHGMLVMEVAAGSVAEKSGIGLGDIVIGVGGTPFRNPTAAVSALASWISGDTIVLDLLRGGKSEIRTLIPGDGVIESEAAA